MISGAAIAMLYITSWCEKYPDKRRVLLNKLSKMYKKASTPHEGENICTKYLLDWFDEERKKELEKTKNLMLIAFADQWYSDNDIGGTEAYDLLTKYGYKVDPPV